MSSCKKYLKTAPSSLLVHIVHQHTKDEGSCDLLCSGFNCHSRWGWNWCWFWIFRLTAVALKPIKKLVIHSLKLLKLTTFKVARAKVARVARTARTARMARVVMAARARARRVWRPWWEARTRWCRRWWTRRRVFAFQMIRFGFSNCKIAETQSVNFYWQVSQVHMMCGIGTKLQEKMDAALKQCVPPEVSLPLRKGY